LRLDPSRRALLLLLGCLLTALLFPAAFSAARVGVGSLLPATAPVTGEVQSSTWADQAALLAHENIRIRQAMAAQPTSVSPIMAAIEADPVARDDLIRAVTARLLHRDVSSRRHSFLIDVGTERGVRRGCAVAHGNSIIGIVQTAADGASRVIRIDDPSSHSVLPATILRIETLADGRVEAEPRNTGLPVARGFGKGVVVVGKLGPGDAAVGDLVVTGSGRFGVPAGLLIGEIESFGDDDRDGEWEAVVRPRRNLDTIVAVYVCVRPELAPEVAPRGGSR
jgi:hypothetical protein